MAQLGLGSVAPNPMVGAVLVHNGKIIGEGWHKEYGSAHAEVNCLLSVSDENKKLIPQSVLYVSLEPCSHHGKTPPCADLIIQEGIKKVVIGTKDPFHLVSGNGVKKLREHEIEVLENVSKSACDQLNKRFITFHTKNRPYIILKFAQSKDGFIAPKSTDNYWLTNDVSKKLVHKWRAEEQGIIVGVDTVLKDNPQLNCRLYEGKSPLRIILDPNLKTEGGNWQVFNNEADTLVFNYIKNDTKNRVQYMMIDRDKNFLEQVLHELHKRKILSLIVEGGRKTIDHFIQQNLWDEARIFTAPLLLHAGLPSPELRGKAIYNEMILEDNLTHYTPL